MDDGCFTQQRFSQDSGVHSQSLLSDYGSSNGLFRSASARNRFGLPPVRSSSAHVHALLTEIRSEIELIPKSLNTAVEAGTNFLSSGIEETGESLKMLKEKATKIEESLLKLDSQENAMSKIINSQLEIKESLLSLSKTVERQGYEIDRMNTQMEEILAVIRSHPKSSNTLALPSSPSMLAPPLLQESPSFTRRRSTLAPFRFRKSLLDS